MSTFHISLPCFNLNWGNILIRIVATISSFCSSTSCAGLWYDNIVWFVLGWTDSFWFDCVFKLFVKQCLSYSVVNETTWGENIRLSDLAFGVFHKMEESLTAGNRVNAGVFNAAVWQTTWGKCIRLCERHVKPLTGNLQEYEKEACSCCKMTILMRLDSPSGMDQIRTLSFSML